jgi:citrate/tricarballylate utilization protein
MHGAEISRQLVDEGERVMRLCNACRYCEGYCAVFPALERRLSFGREDLEYLANLCHNCGECYYACQYAPPQEFQLNFPRTLAELRAATYVKYARPGALRGLFRRNGLTLAVASAAAIVGTLLAIGLDSGAALLRPHPVAEGSFHALVGHDVMVGVFVTAALLAAAALVAGGVAFWRASGRSPQAPCDAPSLARGLWDALRLRYLDGAGEGCSYPDEQSSGARRWFHHLTFYGFALCFASTSVAALYHYGLGWHAPYPLLSLPVGLGVVGGLGLVTGPVGLIALKARRDSALVDPGQTGMDVAFLALLFLVGASGLALLGLRETAAMGVALAVHLGLVLGLFVTAPYGKMVHAVYRIAALVRFAVEERKVPRLGSEG